MSERSPFEPRGDFIAGRFTKPAALSGEIPLEDPGDLDADLPAFPFSHTSLERAIESARRAYPAWRDLDPRERAATLTRFGAVLREESELLANTIAREVGKPLWEARTEVSAMLGKIDITLGAGAAAIGEQCSEIAPGQRARSRPHARGVLAVLGPFNFPGHLVHGHAVPALATGNSIVIKPSERAPAVGQLYAELALRAGFPAGVFNLVQGDAALGAALAAHPDVQGVLFTGSWNVGRRISEATLDQPWKIVVLEMGGKNGLLVCADADIAAAARAAAFGAAVTTGQRCSATSRLIVERAVAAELTDQLARLLGGIRIGHAFDDDVFMGPLISAAARERHARVLELAQAEGAERILDGGPCDGPRRGHYVRPTLHRVTRLLHESPYQCEEHFVPDLHVLEVDSFEEGIAALDSTHYGLSASVFTADRERFERVFRESRVGLLNWNAPTVGASSKLPFGGVGRSGNDRPAGVLSAAYCTYPVASLELEEPAAPTALPGFPESP